MLRCAHFGLSDEALANMTMGMIYDMLTEEGNDREEYPIEATQEDIDSFFGGNNGRKDTRDHHPTRR